MGIRRPFQKRFRKSALGRLVSGRKNKGAKPGFSRLFSSKNWPLFSRMGRLKQELELLTSYSADTIYRLRYDSMAYDYVSPSVTRLLGFTPAEIKKINFRALIIETRIVTNGMKTVESFDDLERSRKSGDVNKWQADYLIRTKDGRKLWISDISYPWFDEEGRIIGSIGSLRDITERIEVEEEVRSELERLAHTDPLTDLPNRREFFERLDYELRRVQRNNGELSLLIMDVDHFKRINDECGHDAGDAVLQQLSFVLKAALRETDIPARLGGEEFGIFLPDTPLEGAYWVAERIRVAMAKHTFTYGSDNNEIGITVSVGAASANQADNTTATELYKMADTRLYIAKNTGRNQVSIDDIVHTH